MALALLVLGAAGANVLWARRAPQVVYNVRFDAVPRELLGLRAESVPVEERIFNYLGADAMEEFLYSDGKRSARLSLVYGTDWRAVHSPLSCLPQQGWQVDEKRMVDVPAPEGAPHSGPLHGQVLVGHKAGQEILVLYLFAHKGGTTGDWTQQGWAVSKTPRGTGGLMISLSAFPRPGQREQAEELLRQVLTSIYLPATSFWYKS